MAYKKILTGLFICFSAFLLMSHNTYALNNQLLGDNWYLYRQTSGNPFCAQNSSDPETRRSSEYSPWNLNIGERGWWSCVDSDSPRSTINAAKGDIIVVELNTDYELSPYWYNTSARYLFSSYSRNIQTIYYATDGFNNSVEFGWVYNSEMNGASNTLFRIQSINIYKPKGQTDYTQALNDIKNNLPRADDIGNAVNDKQEQETQDAADQSQSSGDQAKADSEQATSSLLSTITGFFGALINADVTNCKFNSGLPFLSGSGEIDLCSISTPPIIQVISSLILVGLFIPFAIHMFNRFIGITESFQR